MKQFFFTFSAIILVIFLVAFLFRVQSSNIVNGQPVTVPELEAYADECANQVASEFADKYQITSYGQDFWKSTYHGEQPIQALYEQAVVSLIRHHVIEEAAVSLNLIEKHSFKEEQQEWKQTGSNVSLGQYLAAQEAQLSDRIKKAWLQETPPNKQQLANAFDRLEDKYKQTDYEVSAIEIPGFKGTLAELQKIAQKIPPKLDASAAESWWQQQLPRQMVTLLSLKSSEFQKDDLYRQAAGAFLSGQKTGTVVAGDQKQQFFYIVQVKGGQLLTVEEAPKLAENQYINDLFEERIAEGQEKAKVSLSKKIAASFRTSYQNKN